MNPIGVALLFIVVVIVIICTVINNAHNKHLIESGKGDYYVKIAASGKGTVYHALHCNRSRGAYMVTLAEAESKYYAPCSSCGGRPSIRLKSESSTS